MNAPTEGSDLCIRYSQDGDVEELFAIPFRRKYVIYRPRRHLAFVGNRALVRYLNARRLPGSDKRNKDIEVFLESIGFDRPGMECVQPKVVEPVKPTQAVLLMTNQCNLRCTYCYANAGEESARVQMPWQTAKAVIDSVMLNAKETGESHPSLTLHGGGEPTVHWKTLVRAVEYAKGLDSKFRVSMSSNGVWTKAQREFICRYFDSISLSMDGHQKTQDQQRPRTDGTGSYAAVLKTMRALDRTGMEYGVRMTVLPETAGNMLEGVRFLCAETQARAIQIEPTFTYKRGHYGDIDNAFADVFAEQFMAAWELGRQANRQVYYSAARPWVVSPVFCLAPLNAMVVTADGRLVTCFEVFSERSPFASQFTVGRIRDNRVEFDTAALHKFLETQQQRRTECRDCFCYWHCSGDCATRRPGAPRMKHGRCRVTRAITLRLLLAFMEAGGGFWQGIRETSPVPCSSGLDDSSPFTIPTPTCKPPHPQHSS